MAETAVAVEHPDVLRRAIDDVALRVLAGLDGHRIVAGAELAGEDRAVGGGIRVPAIAVPYAIRFDNTVVGDDLVGVDHVQVPAGTVGKGQPLHPDVPAIAHVDKARPDAARNGVGVLAGGHEVCVLRKVFFQACPLIFNDAACQQPAAGGNGALAPQDDVFAVRPSGMVERAEVQQAAVTFHLGTLKSAGDAGQVIFRLGSALQDGSFVQI